MPLNAYSDLQKDERVDSQYYKNLITWVIETQEGGFVYTDHSSDLGGPTFAGVSFKWFNKWYSNKYEDFTDYNKALEFFSDMSEERHPDFLNLIYEYYQDEFLNRLYIKKIPDTFHKMLFSAAVNFDAKDASKIFQQTLNTVSYNMCIGEQLKTDGIIGNRTITQLNLFFGKALTPNETEVMLKTFKNCFCRFWISSYIKTVKDIPYQITNLEGWINRVWYFVK